MKFKPKRTDRLSPQEREIVDRFERGVIDAAEAGRLLIDSVASAGPEASTSADERGQEIAETDPGVPEETAEAARARERFLIGLFIVVTPSNPVEFSFKGRFLNASQPGCQESIFFRILARADLRP